MSLFSQINDAHLTFGGHAIYWTEILGNLFGAASAVGGMRRKVWAWPVGIVGNVLLFTVFAGTAFGLHGHNHPLIGQAGRQVMFVVVSVYGWVRWHQNRRQHSGSQAATVVRPRWPSVRERGLYLALTAVAIVVCYQVFERIGYNYPIARWAIWADAWIFVGSALATYAMARGWIDFWLCWIAVDLVGVPDLIHAKLYPSAILYAAYAVLVIYGFFAWRRIQAAEALADPVYEAVGV